MKKYFERLEMYDLSEEYSYVRYYIYIYNEYEKELEAI